MALRTTFPALILFLGQFLQATASPLVVGEKGIFDQGFLARLGGSSSSPYSSAEPYTSINTNSDSHSDTIIPTSNNPPEHTSTYPSWFTTTLLARRLLARSSTGIVSTIFPNPLPPNSHAPGSVSGLSVPMPEYIADCGGHRASTTGNDDEGSEGNPTLLALNIGTTFRNTAAGSNISLSIDWWNHLNSTDPIYPGFPLSPAGLPRATLFGYLEHLPTTADDPAGAAAAGAEGECFLDVHPDARAWAPGKEGSPHSSFWARMVVTQVYWVGGFGDVARIGWLNVTEWKGVREDGYVDGVGDGSGRGWGNVRLPGEKD